MITSTPAATWRTACDFLPGQGADLHPVLVGPLDHVGRGRTECVDHERDRVGERHVH